MTQPKIIRWGIAGTGAIAQQFAGDIGLAASVCLTAVCARDPAKAKAFASRHTGVADFGSLAAMIEAQAVDAVYIATSNMAHAGMALECIEARVPVLIEKPMTANLDDALKIRSAARDSGSFVMEAMWSRYLPAVRAARAALADGIIGTVRRLEADIAWIQSYDPHSRFFDKAKGGGALYDIGIYPISLTRYFLGDPLGAEGYWHSAASGVDRAANLRMQFDTGVAEISCSFDRDGSNRMIIEGDRGVLVLGPLFIRPDGFAVYPSRRLADLAQPGGNGFSARLRRKLFAHLPLPGTERHDHRFDGTGLQFEIEAASDAIRQGLREEPDNSLDDTIAALRIIDEILARPPTPG
ncbi:Gfo/Idh/MocA family protein [Hoeflea ulvae]|uniref:Gfo/Idh/MocA family oxidoreductase n=1 Tax=Hoeflea ulvae TaxID=2983764 RepID=A0ABT3YKC5_9HYPH|nr:Gfo/Idh/MocA family oxidoreductase [Hoeflea ulvae]MCY0096267.1 Gfo/Idh/MocA family oxidoreductase [Hoeflea ulvae]